MTTRLTSIVEARDAARRIREIVDARAEWLYACGKRVKASLRRSELEFSVAHGGLIFSCLSDEGAEVWRVHAWMWTGEKLLLEAVRRLGRERALLELIPRISASALAEDVSALRRARCTKLARLAASQLPGATVERASLSAGMRFNQPGSFARILLKQTHARIAVTGIVSDPLARHVDALLSSTLIWFAKLRERASAPLPAKLWIAVEKSCVEPVRQRIALLRDDLRRAISIYEIDEAWLSITLITQYEMEELFKARPPRIAIRRAELSETAARIIELAPEAIDTVRARHGETLRFHGLAFARVRRVMNRERVWFGLEPSSRRILDDETLEDWQKLLSELNEHRRADAPTAHHHALYKRASEAWLESILRRDITRLDPGLRLAPLHAQFRAAQTKKAASRPVDLLALGLDGRLVVIELKVSEDREHVLQGADYWRRIETYRRSGAIARARLFDDAKISDAPPLVYLVAPALRFHRAFRTLAQAVRPEIELYRFDINEDWRAGVRVVRRERAN
jgi:hypothetical protein